MYETVPEDEASAFTECADGQLILTPKIIERHLSPSARPSGSISRRPDKRKGRKTARAQGRRFYFFGSASLRPLPFAFVRLRNLLRIEKDSIPD
jgi:hypothetical protein